LPAPGSSKPPPADLDLEEARLPLDLALRVANGGDLKESLVNLAPGSGG
jgi:hypothetical protein